MNWDEYYLKIAEVISSKSKDPSTKVGCALVRPDHSLCSTGFNGFPQKMLDLPDYLNNRDEKYSRVVHAEINALIFAGEFVKGYTAYTYPVGPCDRCVVALLQAGVSRFVFPEIPEEMKERWKGTIDKSKLYINECGAKFFEVKPELL